MDLSDHSISKASLDPAADAAAMLLRLGFALFAFATPSATLMSRWVIVILVPIGAVLIILSAMLRGDPLRIIKAFLASFRSFGGLTALFLAVWAIASLAWTPMPAVAAPKIFKAMGAIMLGTLAVEALPARMRASNLHLVTIGVGLGGILLLLAVVLDYFGSSLLRVAVATPGRTAVLLTCLCWAAAAWMMIKNRRKVAAGLIALVFGVALLGPTAEAVAPMGVGLIVFAIAWAVPERAGRWLAQVAALLVLAAPVLALIAKLVAAGLSLPPQGFIGSVGAWWDIVAYDPVRLMAGRGFDAAQAARDAGIIPPEANVTLISDIWYDLGLLGAMGLAILLFHAFRAVGRFGLEVAPLALAGLASAFCYALIERGATQTWWMNGLIVFAIVLLSVERGRYRTVRPRASLDRANAAERQGSGNLAAS